MLLQAADAVQAPLLVAGSSIGFRRSPCTSFSTVAALFDGPASNAQLPKQQLMLCWPIYLQGKADDVKMQRCSAGAVHSEEKSWR